MLEHALHAPEAAAGDNGDLGLGARRLLVDGGRGDLVRLFGKGEGNGDGGGDQGENARSGKALSERRHGENSSGQDLQPSTPA